VVSGRLSLPCAFLDTSSSRCRIAGKKKKRLRENPPTPGGVGWLFRENELMEEKQILDPVLELEAGERSIVFCSGYGGTFGV